MDPTALLLRDTLLYLLMPLWLLTGFADYLCHRVLRIEHTAGIREALLHWLLLAEIGAGLAGAFFFEINAGMLALLLAACAAHEFTTWQDLLYASRQRRIPVAEQWVHSLQLVLPWAGWIGLALLHWPQALAMAGLGDARAEWTLHWKQPVVPVSYLIGLASGSVCLVLLPFAEETLRCWRVNAATRRLPGA